MMRDQDRTSLYILLSPIKRESEKNERWNAFFSLG